MKVADGAVFIGDLVKHKAKGTYGIVLEVRKNYWDLVEPLVMVLWTGESKQVLHTSGQIEIIEK